MNGSIKKYLLFSFLLAWILQVVAAVCAQKGIAVAYSIVLALSMYMPMVAVLLSGYSLKPLGWKPHFKKNWRIILLAWFGPSLLGLLGALLFFLVVPGSFDTTGSYLQYVAGPDAIATIEAEGLPLPVYYLVQIVSAMIYAPLINAVFAVGEEIGWRGIMTPSFKEKFGKRKGLLLSGLIWGIWHWPIMVLTGYEYGSSYWGFPILGMILFCFITICMGTLLDYVYEKSGSILIPAVAHGAINGFAGVPLLFLNAEYLDWQLLGPTSVGLVSVLPMAFCTFLLLKKAKDN